ncbi:MAG: M15 family metallopeptidase [Gammaproteobacteria bacterium]
MSYKELVFEINHKLGVPADYAQQRSLTIQKEASNLVEVETNAIGRIFRASPDTAIAWLNMQTAAKVDDIVLQIGSAFRSILYQAHLIEERLTSGRTIDDILIGIAAPGYSEHHTGQAIDIITEDSPPFTEHFELTPAFEWLELNAHQFGFHLSYPRHNPHGFIYEPWHWRYKTGDM